MIKFEIEQSQWGGWIVRKFKDDEKVWFTKFSEFLTAVEFVKNNLI